VLGDAELLGTTPLTAAYELARQRLGMEADTSVKATRLSANIGHTPT
jgi:hypothetical protein